MRPHETPEWKELVQIRQTLEAEAELLKQNHPPRLIAYACLTTAIKTAIAAGMSVDDFEALADDALELYTGGQPTGRTRGLLIESKGDE